MIFLFRVVFGVFFIVLIGFLLLTILVLLYLLISLSDPPDICHLNVKIAKYLPFFSTTKKLPKMVFFPKKLLTIFLTLKWQFSGGSGLHWLVDKLNF